MALSLNASPLEYLTNLDLQAQCRFELFLVRNPLKQLSAGANTGGVLGALNTVANVTTSVVGAAADLFVSKFHIQEISLPSDIKIEFERVNGSRHAKEVVYPETVTMKILADDAGLVRRYLAQWRSEVIVPAGTRGGILGVAAGAAAGAIGGIGGAAVSGLTSSLSDGGFPGEEGTYVFKDNQEAAKRIGTLVLKPNDSSAGLISKYPRIMLYGLVFQELGDYTFRQDESSPLMYELTCSLDEIKIPLLF